MEKVLQIADYIYPCISGIGVTAMDIAQALKSRGIQQKIICMNHNVVEDGIQMDAGRSIRHKVSGIEVIRCRMDLHIASQPISLPYIRILNKVMEEFRPDTVIFHYPNPYMAQFLLHYKKWPFKLAVWWHSDIVKQKVLGKLFTVQNHELLKRADKVVATSGNYIGGSKYLSKYRRKCVVIPNCIREHAMQLTVNEKEMAAAIKPEGKIMCFSLGRHVPYKGFAFLIEAAKYLDSKFVFYIGSTGPLTEELKAQAAGDQRFIFTGHLSQQELKAYYYACDIFCFPSITKNEAFGLALADAMYYGKPSVTFTIPGSGVNYVSPGGLTGIECRNRDARQYAKAIQTLAGNKELREKFGKNAHLRSVREFSFKVFCGKVWELCSQME